MVQESDDDRVVTTKDVELVASSLSEATDTTSVVQSEVDSSVPHTREERANAARWAPFTIGGVSYTFEHLADFEFTCQDSDGVDRTVLVSFSDHVFTRDALSSDQAGDAFPGCSRRPHGYVCSVRYRMSFRLPELIVRFARQKVWCLSGQDRYAQVSVQDDQGIEHLYAIIFTLDRLKGGTQALRMLIRSAHICDRKTPDTFGEVRFTNLVKLRIENRHPRKISDRGRRRPKRPSK
jgi:hypothetical protein